MGSVHSIVWTDLLLGGAWQPRVTQLPRPAFAERFRSGSRVTDLTRPALRGWPSGARPQRVR